MFPIIYKEQIYFLSSSAHAEQFLTNPTKFVARKPPDCPVPVRVSIVGPPKSGKSTGKLIPKVIRVVAYFISDVSYTAVHVLVL